MNVDAMIKHHQAVTEVITHAMSDYASAATGTSWNNACFAFEADAILCALSRAGFRILGPDEVDPVTVEMCVEVAAATDTEKPANWLHRREEIAAAIRALSSPDHADAGKVEGNGCPGVKGVIPTKFGESICFSGIDDARLILVSVCGNSGLVPVKYLLPHQLYVHDVQKLSEQGEVLVCAVPVYDQQIHVTSALPSAPASEGAE